MVCRCVREGCATLFTEAIIHGGCSATGGTEHHHLLTALTTRFLAAPDWPHRRDGSSRSQWPDAPCSGASVRVPGAASLPRGAVPAVPPKSSARPPVLSAAGGPSPGPV